MAVEKLTFEMNAVGNAVPQMQQVQKQLTNVNRTMSTANAGLQRYTRTSVSAGRGLQGLTRNLGMVGLQVQDVAVQASMGTNALRIMSMQGPQILSIFGPLGMIAGAALGVGTALALASGKTNSLSFDFKKFGQDIGPALEPLKPALDGIKWAFGKFVDYLIFAINGTINNFQYLIAAVAAIPDAFRAGLEKAGLYLNSFVLDAQSASYSVQSAVQGMMDALVPGDPKAGFLGMLDDETGYTAAENFAFMARAVKSQAQNMRAVAADTAGVFDTLGNAMKNVTAIDIRDYFGAAAEAVAGDGVDGSPSLTNALTEAQERMKSIAETMKDAFTSGFMSIIDGTKSAKDAFRDMARSIIAKLYEVLVVQRLVGSFDAATGTGTGIVGMLMGAFGGFRANGGPVSGGTPYIVGERGPELFVPSRNGTIVPNGAGGGVTVNQNISFGAGVSRAEIQAMLPRIVETTKAAVFDAQRRSVNGLGYA